MKPALTSARIAAAARHLLNQEGAEAVTMRRVAQAVGITAMAIYRHYPGRAQLLNVLADEGFQDLAASLKRQKYRGNAQSRLLQMADLFLDHALENPHLFELMFLKQREGARRYPQDFKAGRSPTASAMGQVVADGMRTGQLRQDDPWEIVFAMGAMSHGLLMLYLGGRVDATPERFRALYRRSFRRYIRGISS